MKRSTITFAAAGLLVVSMSSFSPVNQVVSKPVVLKAAKAVVFAGISGPSTISINGGPYLFTVSGLPVNGPNLPTLVCGNKVSGEQYLIEPDANGNAVVEIWGSSFMYLKGSQTIWIEDENGILGSTSVFVTN